MNKLLNRTNRVFNGLVPWVIFSILPKNTSLKLNYATILVFVITLLLNLTEIRKKFILPITTLIFFGVYTIAVILGINWVIANTGIMTSSALALMAWGSLFVGKPFTIQYAKEQSDPIKWSHPTFIFINRVLTGVWGILFLLNLIINIAQMNSPGFMKWTNNWLTILTYLIGLWICKKFPVWYRRMKNSV